MRPLITLTTDFGEGRYLAQMKGVLLSMCPDATLVDITHELAPHDVAGAAYLLRDVVPSFPAKTIHLVVVDPGVGSTRRGIAVRASQLAAGQYFVGPDNGTFTEVLEGSTVHELTAGPRASVVSAVFHGRDVFAPAVAHLASGSGIDTLGPVIRDPVRLGLPKARVTAQGVVGEALFVDRFGNIATNIELQELPPPGEDGLKVEVGWARLDGIARHYSEVAVGEMIALVGSSGRLEIAVREGSAAQRLQLRDVRGTPVRVVRGLASMYGAVAPA